MQVILFDIDGTLIHSGGAGLAALQLAFTEAFGFTKAWDISLSGRTDRGIARELFRDPRAGYLGRELGFVP